MSLIAIRDFAREIAHGEVGQREQGGNNRGPAPRKYLAAVNLPEGHAWCCAGVVWCYQESTLRVGHGLRMPVPRTGKCAHFWARCPAHWKSHLPSIGAIYVHLVEPSDPDSDGHVGIVDGYTERSVVGVEFNTNALGSRSGDRVRLNTRGREYVNMGYIDVGREGPVDSPDVA